MEEGFNVGQLSADQVVYHRTTGREGVAYHPPSVLIWGFGHRMPRNRRRVPFTRRAKVVLSPMVRLTWPDVRRCVRVHEESGLTRRLFDPQLECPGRVLVQRPIHLDHFRRGSIAFVG